MNAMRDEMDFMMRNSVWGRVDLPPWCKSVGNKWVYKIKCQEDGTINKCKDRLVAKGFT